MKRELTEEEYNGILTYLQQAGIAEVKPQTELADHLAVITELHLESGKPFNEAFAQARAQLNVQELTEIGKHAATLTYYPRFLGKWFLSLLAILCLLVFVTGLYLKRQQLPHHHLWIVAGRRSFIFIWLPLWLLYSLTEYANKTRQVLTFLVMFTIAQTGFDWLVKQRLNPILLASSCMTILIWLTLFRIIPLIRNANTSNSHH